MLRELAQADTDAVLDVGGHEVALSSLDRIYWPAAPEFDQAPITKRDFIAYLIAQSTAMLPHLADRPLTLFRWPEGVSRRRVLMKHWEIRLPDFVERVDIYSESKGRPDQYILCNNLATLVWLGHMGTLELHAWHSRVTGGDDAATDNTDFTSSAESLQASVIELPDYMLFDIDPFIYSGREPKGRHPEFNPDAFAQARDVAFALKALLDGMGLQSWVKTSGKTGLHVVVPIRRTLRYEVVREMARHIGDYLMRRHPDEITVDWNVDRRRGKVFIDYNMNVRGKSMTTPYSTRGLAVAPVSMPLSWRALKTAQPLDFRLPTVGSSTARRDDPWADVLEAKQSLEQALAAGR
jgi:bifunctional non-homologous end joining protein LigD